MCRVFPLAVGKPTAPHENLFTDKGMFNKGGMTNTQNSHVWSLNNPHASMETHFEIPFSPNIWWGIFRSQVTGPFVLGEHLASECYLRFLED
jgi:hypothetical protein